MAWVPEAQAVDSEIYFFFGFVICCVLLYQFFNELCFSSFQHFGNAV